MVSSVKIKIKGKNEESYWFFLRTVLLHYHISSIKLGTYKVEKELINSICVKC